MDYVAMKPCRFSGKDYVVGEIIPGDVILPGAVKVNEQAGKIAKVSDVEASINPDETVGITVGDTELFPTFRGINMVFDVLIGNAGEAEEIIRSMDENDALVLLHMADSRKSVKAAAEARAKELFGGEGEG